MVFFSLVTTAIYCRSRMAIDGIPSRNAQLGERIFTN